MAGPAAAMSAVGLYSQVGSIPVVIDPHVPLFASKRDELGRHVGSDVDRPVLFWIIFGQVHVHPDRIEEFRRHITSQQSFPYQKAAAE